MHTLKWKKPICSYIDFFLCTNSLNCNWTFCELFSMTPNFFFSFYSHTCWHMEVPGLGVELELQLKPKPQPWQLQIWAASLTFATTCSRAVYVTHWVKPGIKPAFSQRQYQVLNPLSHNRNANTFFLLWLPLQHMKVPETGIESKTELQPMSQL